jgi:hypothetical protein
MRAGAERGLDNGFSNYGEVSKKSCRAAKRHAAAQADIQEAAACRGKAIGGAEMASRQGRVIG